jgi:hypothetical protein
MTGTFVSRTRKRWEITAAALAHKSGTTAYDVHKFEEGRLKPKGEFFRNNVCEALRLIVIEAAKAVADQHSGDGFTRSPIMAERP